MLVMAGLLAGAMNAIAGGGSFVTFPALVFVGLPPVIANATSTVALLPGTIASSWAYRKGIGGIGGLPMRVLLPVTLVDQPAPAVPRLKVAERENNFNEVEVGFDEPTAQQEAMRCLRCDLEWPDLMGMARPKCSEEPAKK